MGKERLRWDRNPTNFINAKSVEFITPLASCADTKWPSTNGMSGIDATLSALMNFVGRGPRVGPRGARRPLG